jgi:hypothetical protein
MLPGCIDPAQREAVIDCVEWRGLYQTDKAGRVHHGGDICTKYGRRLK